MGLARGHASAPVRPALPVQSSRIRDCGLPRADGMEQVEQKAKIGMHVGEQRPTSCDRQSAQASKREVAVDVNDVNVDDDNRRQSPGLRAR